MLPMLPRFLTINEVADLKGLSRTAVYNAMNNGALPFTLMLGKRAVRESDAKKWKPTGRRTGRPKGIPATAETKAKISEGHRKRRQLQQKTKK